MRIEKASPQFKLLFVGMAAVMAAACQADNGAAASPPTASDATVAPAMQIGIAGPTLPATSTPGSPLPATPTPASAVAAVPSAADPAETLPQVLVHKSATCGCCGAWVDHLRAAGFSVQVNETEDINPIKERLGVPYGKGSCHTAEVGGYVVEGHVPAADIKRLLAERPKAKGLVLPGMPIGSPGMEVPDGTVQPYTVELVAPDGQTQPYARHGG